MAQMTITLDLATAEAVADADKRTGGFALSCAFASFLRALNAGEATADAPAREYGAGVQRKRVYVRPQDLQLLQQIRDERREATGKEWQGLSRAFCSWLLQKLDGQAAS